MAKSVLSGNAPLRRTHCTASTLVPVFAVGTARGMKPRLKEPALPVPDLPDFYPEQPLQKAHRRNGRLPKKLQSPALAVGHAGRLLFRLCSQ